MHACFDFLRGAEGVGGMVLFVASDEASCATGSAFVSDGGMLAGVL